MIEQNNTAEEISLKDIIVYIKNFFSYTIKKSLYYLPILLLVGGLLFYLKQNKVNKFMANKIFTIETASNGFNFQLPEMFGGENGSSSEEIEKMIAITKSKNIISKSLLDSFTTNEKLIDKFIKLHFKEYQKLELDTTKTLFNHKDYEKLSLTERSLFNKCYKHFLNETFEIKADDLNIITLVVKSKDEKWSIETVESIYRNILTIYESDIQIEKKEDLIKLQKRVDSLSGIIQYYDKQLSNRQNTRRNITDFSLEASDQDIRRKKQVAETTYYQSVQNLEMQKYALKNSKTNFSIIENPLEPLDIERRESTIITVIKAVIFSFVFFIVLVFIMKFYEDNISPILKEI